MDMVAQGKGEVTVGVDTHKEVHVGVALDGRGRRLGELMFPATPVGYRQLVSWAEGYGEIAGMGVEGTGSFGAGLARHLRSRGIEVKEVNRPSRAARRLRGKSDPVDAEAAARAVLAGTAAAMPKAGDDAAEMVRLLKVARRGAVKAQTQAVTTLHSMLVSVPDELRERLGRLSTTDLVRVCSRLRPGELSSPSAAAATALRSIARRHQALAEEIKALDSQLQALVEEAAPTVLAIFGVGVETAGTLLVASGDNPERMRSESTLASLCGVSPVEASSGKTKRHRLNRGGNRQANRAIHAVILTRLRWHPPTREYVARRTTGGLTKREIIRCLKRYLVREVFRALLADSALRTSKKAA